MCFTSQHLPPVLQTLSCTHPQAEYLLSAVLLGTRERERKKKNQTVREYRNMDATTACKSKKSGLAPREESGAVESFPFLSFCLSPRHLSLFFSTSHLRSLAPDEAAAVPATTTQPKIRLQKTTRLSQTGSHCAVRPAMSLSLIIHVEDRG